MHQPIKAFRPNRSSKGRSRYPYWETKDGVKMRLEDMTPSHLRNAMRQMERGAQQVATAFAMYACEMAADVQEAMIDDTMEDAPTRLPDQHYNMGAELRRRGLTVEPKTL